MSTYAQPTISALPLRIIVTATVVNTFRPRVSCDVELMRRRARTRTSLMPHVLQQRHRPFERLSDFGDDVRFMQADRLLSDSS